LDKNRLKIVDFFFKKTDFFTIPTYYLQEARDFVIYGILYQLCFIRNVNALQVHAANPGIIGWGAHVTGKVENLYQPLKFKMNI
jgi:hypothetical protein